MRRLIDPRATRVAAAIGALGATCTLTINAHGAPATGTGARLPRLLRPSSLATLTPRAPRGLAIDRLAAATRKMIGAGDRIATLPYLYGGGHGSFTAGGYDCSGSVSYVLHAAGLLSVPEASTALESYGDPGRGRHVTIYANAAHAWMTIDGRRFDTIALQETGTRWSRAIPSAEGYVVRHPRGL
jgi:hypothetical protein